MRLSLNCCNYMRYSLISWEQVTFYCRRNMIKGQMGAKSKMNPRFPLPGVHAQYNFISLSVYKFF